MITIVDYNAGNLRSVKRACDAVGIRSRVSSSPSEVSLAERIIFPGIGHARTAMETLEKSGLAEALNTARERGTPILGICVGAQLMLEGSDEGPVKGLGWIPGRTRLLQPSDPSLKVPHIGWNEIHVLQWHPLLKSIEEGDQAYFVHAYYLDPQDAANRFADSEYGGAFCCAIGQNNVFATQFHPEKSGRVGLTVLKHFASWDGGPC